MHKLVNRAIGFDNIIHLPYCIVLQNVSQTIMLLGMSISYIWMLSNISLKSIFCLEQILQSTILQGSILEPAYLKFNQTAWDSNLAVGLLRYAIMKCEIHMLSLWHDWLKICGLEGISVTNFLPEKRYHGKVSVLISPYKPDLCDD